MSIEKYDFIRFVRDKGGGGFGHVTDDPRSSWHRKSLFKQFGTDLTAASFENQISADGVQQEDLRVIISEVLLEQGDDVLNQLVGIQRSSQSLADRIEGIDLFQALPGTLQQPRILDRDRRLRAKRFEQLGFMVRKGMYLMAFDANGPKLFCSGLYRRNEKRRVQRFCGRLQKARIVVYVANVNGDAFLQDLPCSPTPDIHLQIWDCLFFVRQKSRYSLRDEGFIILIQQVNDGLVSLRDQLSGRVNNQLEDDTQPDSLCLGQGLADLHKSPRLIQLLPSDFILSHAPERQRNLVANPLRKYFLVFCVMLWRSITEEGDTKLIFSGDQR